MTERLRPWLPAGLAAHGFTHETVQTLSYVFLDEAVDRIATFLIHPWPSADELGRLRFEARDEQLELSLSRDDVRGQLYRRFRRRDPRPGDAFAARIRPAAVKALQEGRPPAGIDDLVEGTVYDVSVEARLVAKLAYHASLAAVVPDRKADAWGLPPPVKDDTARPAPARVLGGPS
jgi:hypothetical protein